MKWVHHIIKNICQKLKIIKISDNQIKTDQYIIKIINDENLFSIKVIDLIDLTPPVYIKNIYFDHLEQQLTDIVKAL